MTLSISSVNPMDLIDTSMIEASRARHATVEQRLPNAEARLAEFEATHMEARKLHIKAMAGDGGDPVETMKTLQQSADNADLLRDSLVHIREAIRRSASQLNREILQAQKPALDAAVRQAIAAAKRLDEARKIVVPEAIADYKAACVAVNQLCGDPTKLSTANFWLKPVEDWTNLDDVRGNVAPSVAATCGIDLSEVA